MKSIVGTRPQSRIALSRKENYNSDDNYFDENYKEQKKNTRNVNLRARELVFFFFFFHNFIKEGSLLFVRVLNNKNHHRREQHWWLLR